VIDRGGGENRNTGDRTDFVRTDFARVRTHTHTLSLSLSLSLSLPTCLPAYLPTYLPTYRCLLVGSFSLLHPLLHAPISSALPHSVAHAHTHSRLQAQLHQANEIIHETRRMHQHEVLCTTMPSHMPLSCIFSYLFHATRMHLARLLHAFLSLVHAFLTQVSPRAHQGLHTTTPAETPTPAHTHSPSVTVSLSPSFLLASVLY